MSYQHLYIDILNQPITYDMVHDFLGDDEHGGHALFFGIVRKTNLGRKVRSIAYDVHIPYAKQCLHEICLEAIEQWGEALKACVLHTNAHLRVGEVSVAIGVSTPHRDEAFKACRFVIDELKHRAPIWKKEYYDDGESEWVKGHALCQMR